MIVLDTIVCRLGRFLRYAKRLRSYRSQWIIR